MKQLAFFLIFSTCIFNLKAQDSITINLTNQYKKSVESAVIVINGINYTSDKAGNITIPAITADSIAITKKGYGNQQYAVNSHGLIC